MGEIGADGMVSINVPRTTTSVVIVLYCYCTVRINTPIAFATTATLSVMDTKLFLSRSLASFGASASAVQSKANKHVICTITSTNEQKGKRKVQPPQKM